MKLKVFLYRFIVVFLVLAVVAPFPAVEAAAEIPSQVTNEIAPINALADGTEIYAQVIDGPPEPPAEYAEERAASMVTSLDRATTLANFPSYNWVFGCSAVSAAMIAAYYDNNGYSNMYTGLANGGVMPITDTGWGTWYDGDDTYPNNPLVASHSGVDGQVGRGSIDDYWVEYGSPAADPYITGSWLQHDWGSATGDYMKTSQSAFENDDGSTAFYNYTSVGNKLYCSNMPSLYDEVTGFYLDERDGTYGRKLFYEERGYTITECYNQNTSNRFANGFSLANFQAEIDAGNPVLLNLNGHSIVGFGYSGSTIYIRDTWDSDPNHTYSMTWGGSYGGMELLSVSIVHIQALMPGVFGKVSPTNGAINQWTSPTLSWGSSSGATSYEYCYYESGGSCGAWTSAGTSTSVSLSGLSETTTYEWQVRAINSAGTTYANGSDTAFWSFTTIDPSAFTESVYLPLITE